MSVDPAAPVETGRYCLVCCLEKGGEDTCGSCGSAVDAKPPRQPSNLPPGTLLDRRYLVGRSLGSGTFGITYLAVDIWLRLRVAVKEYMPRDMAMRSREDDVVPNTDGDRDAFVYGLQSFLDEGRKLARFEGHPNIVGVKSFFEENGTAYLVMQYLDGCSLEAYRRGRGGRLPAGEVVAIALSILEGLQAIHAVGMLHRDIKPQNVILTTTGKVKLIDFGAARFAAGQRTSNLSQVLTPRYAPIEQYQSDEIQGPWTDVYATGATLYKVLTGRLPPEAIARVLEGATLSSPRKLLGAEVSETISAALMRALEPSAAARYQTAEEFIEGLCDPEQTPLVWPSPPSAHLTPGEGSCRLAEAGVVSSSDLKSVASARPGSGSAPSRSSGPAPAGPGSGSGSSPSRRIDPGSGSSPSRRIDPASGSSPSRSLDPGGGSSPSRSRRPAARPPAREATEATRPRPRTRRDPPRRKTRVLWWLNGLLALLVLAIAGVLVLLLLDGDRTPSIDGCGELTPTACAAEAVRLEAQGRSVRGLLLAYLAPVEEPDIRDRIFDRAGVDADWGSEARFGCAPPPTPCSSLDFWKADREAPGGDQALAALAGRCDLGDRDACYLRILIQRRLTLIEHEGTTGPGAEPGVEGDFDRLDVAGPGAAAREPGRASPGPVTPAEVIRRDPPQSSERAGSDEPIRGSSTRAESERSPSGTGSAEPAASETGTSSVEPAERVPEERSERVVGESSESSERVVGESSESTERVVGESSESSERVVGESSEPTERVVGESTERVVGESTERVVGEPTERVVGEPSPDTSEPDSNEDPE
jgi:serine/threonine protein kinase